MMLIFSGNDASQHKEILNQAFTLRHEIFVDELGWEDIRKEDGLETDQFDHEEAVHMCLLDDNNKLVGYQRMLPTNRPNLLSDIYPYLCDGEIPSSEYVWQWTRFAVPKSLRKGRRTLGLQGNLLVSGWVDWAIDKGLESVIVETSPMWTLSLCLLNFKVSFLGVVHDIEGEQAVALRLNFDKRTQEKLALERNRLIAAEFQKANH